MFNTFFTGLLWGLSFFYISGVPSHYYYILFGLNIGITSAGLLSLGVIPRIFYAFATPLMGLSMLWMFTQNDSVHTFVGLMTALGIIYYFTFVNRYANKFKQVYKDKEIIQNHLTELTKIQQANTVLKERTELALQGSGTAILDWNYIHKTSYISPNWKDMLGFKDNELDNTYATWRLRVHPADLRSALKELKHTKDNKEPFFNNTHRLRHRDGHYLWILGKAHLTYTSDGILSRIIGTHVDITQEKTAQDSLLKEKEKLRHQAYHDALTGLPNRLLFTDKLGQILIKAKRYKTKIALLFIDLDHFKEINDSLGHNIGDQVLQHVTSRLLSTIKSEDSIARFGGDEFTIVLEDLAQGKDASLLAKKILYLLSKAIHIETHELYISSSIGISLFPQDGDVSADLLKYADSAMYKAKEEGRNNFQFYTPEMTKLALERVIMETSLREAIQNEDFLVYYQAQVDGTKNKIIGMEALVRWNHQTMGIVSPDNFIPLAESTGLIIEIDRYVMRTAMTQMAAWYKQGLNPGILAMNLTVRQLQDKNFIKIFKALMDETRCKAEWIELEITEGQIMHNPDEAIKILNNISDMGIEIAIDDFGTGYSSLSYLKKLPINKLKIDQSFVRNLPDDEEDVVIAKAVIALAQSLNLHIIAEGVETKAQKDFIIANGCPNIQGYFYSKPIPAGEFEQLLHKGVQKT
jgi:diguanylate cyclase (GGDEF)-like protein/PAS domain S-box-containing protein